MYFCEAAFGARMSPFEDMVSGARHLLRRLLAAGVTDLDSLKLRS